MNPFCPHIFFPLFVFFLSMRSAMGATEIPPFEANVVDQTGTLSLDEKTEINNELQKIRDGAGIWGAVYLLDSLAGESIESLAERSFRKWELGKAGLDNGLLLVLAVKDRKSRFEVGYGLEGDLPDVIARRALDEVLRPKMQAGKVKEAIVDAFEYMAAAKKGETPVRSELIGIPTNLNEWIFHPELRFAWAVYLLYFGVLWIFPGAVLLWSRKLAARLEGGIPGYLAAKDPTLAFFSLKNAFTLPFKLFLTVNPGVFILFFAKSSVIASILIVLMVSVAAWFYARKKIMRYTSVPRYLESIEPVRYEWRSKVLQGYAIETFPGQFKHTAAWYESPEYKTSRTRFQFGGSSGGSSRSSSSSSSSSNSGGGRSGGGGASSGW